MYKKTVTIAVVSVLACFLVFLAGAQAAAEDAEQDATKEPSAEEIMRQAHLGLYYSGDDGRAVVTMELKDKKGKTRTRKFTMVRLDIEEGGAQKYYTYFTEPSDVRRTSFMVWKEPDKDDARWIYIPALDLVKRISANDKTSSFVGSDFSYEDVSGRHWNDDEHKLLRSEEVEGRRYYVIESVPKADKVFAKKITWVSLDLMLPEREEYYDKKGELTRIFEAEGVEEIGGFPTVTKRRMTNVKKNHSTLVEFSEVEYNIGLEDNLFTERYLKAPPKEYITP
jgi:outer membrane lipoprotein-sorting protein